MAAGKRTATTSTSAIKNAAAEGRFELASATLLPWLKDPDALVGITFDIVRPQDLVALRVCAVDCTLVKADRSAWLVAGAKALLSVSYAYQHALEEAQYEEAAPVPKGDGTQDGNEVVPLDPKVKVEVPTSPVRYIPARGSRVVFEIPAGESIEFSTAGVLEAMTRLRMRVHRLATPGVPDERGTTSGRGRKLDLDGPFLHLGQGLVLELQSHGMQISSPGRDFFNDHPAPDATTAAGAAHAARQLQSARRLMAVRRPTVAAGTRIPRDSEFRPGGRWVGPTIRPARPGRPRTVMSSPPSLSETAIEAPYRLVMSPSNVARWAHAVDPVRNPDVPSHVELWHSRLAGTLPAGALPEDLDSPDEHDAGARSLRAIWARDRDLAPDWRLASAERPGDPPSDPGGDLSHTYEPFIASLDRLDRHILVRQTSETWAGKGGALLEPHPVGTKALWLSGLGAWLDVHGAWDTKPYSQAALSAILSWDHIAPQGRDQFVRVVYPGYLYPFGHQAALVKVTERKIKTPDDPKASLYQRMFIVIGERSRTYGDATYEQRQLPFSRVDIRPHNTPPIDQPKHATDISKYFWPQVGGQPFNFVVDAWDREHHQIKVTTPLLWVAEAWQGKANLDALDAFYAKNSARRLATHGQRVSFVPRGTDPDTDLQTESIWLLGRAVQGDSVPRMSSANVFVPAVQRLNPQADPMPITFFDKYLEEGLAQDQKGAVWARTLGPGSTGQGTGPGLEPTLSSMPVMRFGQGGAGSDRTGGFMAPSLSLEALARDSGPVADPAGIAAKTFDPMAFLDAAGGKLFGLVPLSTLVKLLAGDSLSQAPSFVTETLGRIQALKDTLERLGRAIEEAQHQAGLMVDRGLSGATQAVNAATKLKTDAGSLVKDLGDLLQFGKGPLANADAAAIESALQPLFAKIPVIVADLDDLGTLLPPEARQLMGSVAGALREFASLVDVLEELVDFFSSLDPKNLQVSMRYEWAPELADWDSSFPTILFTPKNGVRKNLVVRVEGRVAASGETKMEAIAEIRDFTLQLFGSEPLVRFPIHHMAFKAGSSGKPEIDVLLGEIEFLNALSFVETIKDLIPFDGFSDPPYVDVDSSGARAGFTLALPNLAIGVFSLANISLGADVSVPFLGKVVTAGFNFCTREKPFSLTVMCLGGGGWFGLRVSPEGLEVLELGLEAQACLSVDFGVASGSISAAVGVYIRLEGEDGSITGYFRLRGEVDVLGLISASIELYMSLTYNTKSGKMIGKATITVQVHVLVFSGSVHISAERQLAGANGDPSFREVLGADATGTSPYWTTYCDAFAGE